MITDKKLGLKIAENPIEVLWERTRETTEMRIKELENTLIIERAFLGLCESQVKCERQLKKK
jgi:hypothetical protein